MSVLACHAQPKTKSKAISSTEKKQPNTSKIRTGAEQLQLYLPLLKNKKVGMVVNPTSVIGDKKTALVDSLLALGVQIKKIFGPEHGFRGNASNGAKVNNEIDEKTNIPIISLYGKNQYPTEKDLSNLDILVFDIQDVGVRFYTYINTLQYVMEACATFHKPLLILDRPNPNGYFVDGPILDQKLVSGIGLQPIPIVHGLTIAEYAQMLNGERWLKNGLQCELKIVKVENYTHQTPYRLPVKPSPNLNTDISILLYPTLCLFEGTYISQGRGTHFPFTVLGAPALKGKYTFEFTPKSIPGMSETPLHQNQVCYGLDLRKINAEELFQSKQLQLKWLIEMYQNYPKKEDFFNNKLSKQMGNFDKLAGNFDLKNQIIQGKSEKEIRASWEKPLAKYLKIRAKYLLYP